MSRATVLRLITPEQNMGLAPVGWSSERDGGMYNVLPYRTSWDFERPERNAYWVEKGFSEPRELYFQTPLQRAAPRLVDALIRIASRLEAFELEERDMPLASVEVTRSIAQKVLEELRIEMGFTALMPFTGEPASEPVVEPTDGPAST